MLGHWINIYNLCYHIVVLKKKPGKVVKNCSSRTLFGQKLGQHGPQPKWSSIIFLEIKDNKLSIFISSKYIKFWLSYEWFSDLCNILLPKPATSGWKRCEKLPTSDLLLFNWLGRIIEICPKLPRMTLAENE